MNIDSYLKKHGISFSDAANQLNLRAEALRAYSSRARYANPEIQEIIIEWSNGEILKESFKEAYRYKGHVGSEPRGEIDVLIAVYGVIFPIHSILLRLKTSLRWTNFFPLYHN